MHLFVDLFAKSDEHIILREGVLEAVNMGMALAGKMPSV